MPDGNLLSVANVIMALAALGTASFGLVDALKAAGGGVSRAGLGDIKKALKSLFGPDAIPTDRATPLTYGSILANLRANWMNGTNLADQKAIAKSLVKLRLNPDTAEIMAKATGVVSATLKAIATAIRDGTALTAPQADAFGRFDLALTALFDQAYQRADQRYRNYAKALAGLLSIVIAMSGGYFYYLHHLPDIEKPYFSTSLAWIAALAGALATPIAPVAKDLTSAIAAGANVIQNLQKAK